MAPKTDNQPVLLRWTERIVDTDIQDPLGLSLRGSARLASRLLYCITSITPRARYFSFLPWCIYDYQSREANQPHKAGLRKAIQFREQALTLGCVAHHEGEACSGGVLVGSKNAIKWFRQGQAEISFKRRAPFAKTLALGAYFSSLVNLHLFETDEDQKADEEADDEAHAHTFDDLRLSPLGLDLAQRLDRRLGGLAATAQISSKDRVCAISDLRRFGSRAGLCELASSDAPDLPLLRDLFFANMPLGRSPRKTSHPFRRRTLLLLLDLCRQIAAAKGKLSETTFAEAVYYGSVAKEEHRLTVAIPSPLQDIANRWRMFYFHYFMSVALEGLFAWLVTSLAQHDLRGASLDTLVNQADGQPGHKAFNEYSGLTLPSSALELSAEDILAILGVPAGASGEDLGLAVDTWVRPSHPLAEANLVTAIRRKDHISSPLGLVLPLILLSVTLGRFQRWRHSRYGRWLAKTVRDRRLDLVPPLVLVDLEKHDSDWWKAPLRSVAIYVLSRFVVDQHQGIAYVKSKVGDGCLLQRDDNSSRLVADAAFEKIGLGNPRLGSALQILNDLGFIVEDDDGVPHLTPEGDRWLDAEIGKEPTVEVP
jgi:hypothetical protein